MDIEITYICPNHGEVTQKPRAHLDSTFGCYQCYLDTIIPSKKRNKPKILEEDRIKVLLENFIKKAQKRHVKEDGITPRYKYHKVIMRPKDGKEIFICDEHGEFLQPRKEHLRYGCLLCGLKKNILETKLYNYLKRRLNDFNIVHQGKPNWLGRQSFDIYLPDFNIAVEYQGEQHFKSIPFFGGEEQFIIQLELDRTKRIVAQQNNCRLFLFTYDEKHIPVNYQREVFTNHVKLLMEISLEIDRRKRY